MLLAHKEALFAHLRARWTDLFAASYDLLLYDRTSTYFECDQPKAETDPRKFGYSRDRRSDCVQVVIAMVVTGRADIALLTVIERFSPEVTTQLPRTRRDNSFRPFPQNAWRVVFDQADTRDMFNELKLTTLLSEHA